MSMKRFALLSMLIFALIFALIACGNGGEDETQAQSTETQSPTDNGGASDNVEDNNENSDAVFVEFVGADDIHVAAGASLSDIEHQVSARLSDGSTRKATLELGNADLARPGQYEITFKYDQNDIKVKLFVYGDVQLYYGDSVIAYDSFRVKYSEAKKADFALGIVARDSFGNALRTEASDDSESYTGGNESFSATFFAEDKAGNKLEKSVSFEVIPDKHIRVYDRHIYKGTVEDACFVLDICDAESVTLFDERGEIASALYSVSEGILTLKNEYFEALPIGEYPLLLRTEYGYADFALRISDTANDIKTLISNNSAYSTWRKADVGFSAAGFDYAYEYSKASGVGADGSLLAIRAGGYLSRITFDIYVAYVNSGSYELQTDGSAPFVSVVDSEGNDVAICGNTAAPYVMLKQGGVYSITLDLSNCGDSAAIKVWSSRSVRTYYSNFVFEYSDRPTDLVLEQRVLYKSSEKLGYFAWPSLASMGKDRLIAVSSGFREAHVDPFGKVIGWISEDGGENWGAPFVIADTVLDDRDAGVIYWNEKLIVTWFTAPNRNYTRNSEWTSATSKVTAEDEAKYLGALWTVSEDGGRSWTEPSLFPIFSPHGFIESPDGELVYVGYCNYDQSKGAFTAIGMVKSADGVNWSDVKVIVDGDTYTAYDLHEPHAVFNDEGTLIVQLRTGSAMYQCESFDNGDTFTDIYITSDISNTPPHFLKLEDGTIVLTYGYRNPPFGIRARISYDGGITWSAEMTLTSDGPELDMGYPDTVQLSDGRMLTVYYQKEKASDRHPGIMQIIWELPEKPKGEFTVTFESNGGSAVAPLVGNAGDKMVEPTAPTRGGDEFLGWYIDPATNIKYKFGSFNRDVTLYAKWRVRTPSVNAASDKYVSAASESEISAIGYTGNAKVFKYVKPSGEGGSNGSSAEMWINTYNSTTLTYSFYIDKWQGDGNKTLEMACARGGTFVLNGVTVKRCSDGATLTTTKGANGYHTVVETGVWYTATVDVTGADKSNMFCFWNAGMTAYVTDVRLS